MAPVQVSKLPTLRLITVNKLLKLWCPCSPIGENWCQLARGQDTVAIMPCSLTQGDHLVAVRLYVILKLIQKKNCHINLCLVS